MNRNVTSYLKAKACLYIDTRWLKFGEVITEHYKTELSEIKFLKLFKKSLSQ